MISELIEKLKRCPEYSCSRCRAYGTPHCAIREAIRELKRFDQILDVTNNMEEGDSDYELSL